MSRITPGDRPIPNSEPVVVAEQVSESESIAKTGIAGEALPETEQAPPKLLRSAEPTAQQTELRLNGIAREAELQRQFTGLIDRPNLNPNVNLDETVDVTRNIPGGHKIDTGLGGLDWGPTAVKSGPNHMGVDMTSHGMKAPNDVIADVLNAGKPSAESTPRPQNTGGVKESAGGGGSAIAGKEGGSSMLPPTAELNFRAPNSDLISSGKKLPEYVPPSEKEKTPPAEKSLVDKAKEKFNDMFYGKPDAGTPPPKPADYMTDPDAVGGDVLTSDDIERKVKIHFGSNTQGINPDLGAGSGPITADDIKKPFDLVRDPIGDGETSVGKLTDEQIKLANEINGPRTVNPDLGLEPKPAGGSGPKGGPLPNTGD